jgi:ABC-type dipeptide/oligopeptide/nickel transport system ATPase component
MVLLENVKTIVSKAIGTTDTNLINATLKNIDFTAKVDSHKLDDKTALPAFQKDIEKPVFNNINKTVRKFKPPGRVGQNTKFDIADNKKAVETISGFMFESSDNKKAVETISGFMFESFLESVTKVPAQGDTAPFDFKGKGSLKQFSKIVQPKVTAQFLDAKRSRVTPAAIVSKAANEGLFDSQLTTATGKKKILQARDEARSELGATAKSLKASAKKASGGFVQRFQGGGEVGAITQKELRRIRDLTELADTPSKKITKEQRAELKKLRDRRTKFGIAKPVNVELDGGFGVAFLNIGATGKRQEIAASATNIDEVATKNLRKSVGAKNLEGKEIGKISAKPQLFGIQPEAKENFTREVIDPIGVSLQKAANKSLGANQIGNIPFNDLVSKSGFNATVGQLFEGFVRTATKSGKVAKTGADDIFDIPNVGSAENFKTLFGSEITSGTPLEIKGNEQLDAKLIGNLLSKHIKANKPQATIKKASGGGISGQDTVPALLTPGEFVINKDAAKAIGGTKLRQLNKADKVQGFNKGGFVGMQDGGEVETAGQKIAKAAVSSDNLGRKGLQTVVDNVQPGQKVSAILGVAGSGKSRFALGAAQLTSPEQAANASELLFEQANENVKPGSVLSKILALTKSTGGTVTLINPPAEQVRQQRQLRAEVGATSPADTRSAGQLKGIAKAGDKIPLSFSKEFITFLRNTHQSNLIEQKASGGFIDKLASGGFVRMQTGGEVAGARITKAAVSSDNLGRKGLQTVLENVQPNQKISAILGVAGSGKSRFALGAEQLTSPEQAAGASELLFEQANENVKPGSVLSKILALTKSTGGTVTLINPPAEQVREQRQRRAEVGATSPADTRSAGQLKGIAKAGDKIPLSFSKEFVTFLRNNHSNLVEQKAMGGFIEKLGQGGIIKRFAQGGLAKGTDTVPALLTPGEFVIKKDSARKIGKDNLESLNQAGKFASGGFVNKNIQNGTLLGLFRENAVDALQTGGRVRPKAAAKPQSTESKPSIAKLRRIIRGQSLSPGVQSLVQRINQLSETEASQLLSAIPTNARVIGSGREGIALDIGNGRVVRLGSVGTPQSFLGVTGTFEGRPDVEEFLQPLLTPTGQKAVKTVRNISAEVLPKAIPLDRSGATPEQQTKIIQSIVTSLNRKGFLQTDLGPQVAGNIGLIREGGKVKAKIIDPNVAIQIKDRKQAEEILGPQDPQEAGRGGFIKRFHCACPAYSW